MAVKGAKQRKTRHKNISDHKSLEDKKQVTFRELSGAGVGVWGLDIRKGLSEEGTQKLGPGWGEEVGHAQIRRESSRKKG